MFETTGIPETNEGGRTYWKEPEALSEAVSRGEAGAAELGAKPSEAVWEVGS